MCRLVPLARPNTAPKAFEVIHGSNPCGVATDVIGDFASPGRTYLFKRIRYELNARQSRRNKKTSAPGAVGSASRRKTAQLVSARRLTTTTKGNHDTDNIAKIGSHRSVLRRIRVLFNRAGPRPFRWRWRWRYGKRRRHGRGWARPQLLWVARLRVRQLGIRAITSWQSANWLGQLAFRSQ